MPEINDIVNISVLEPSTALQESNFKTPCIFTTDTPDDPSFDFYRKYSGTQLSNVGVDFGTNSDTYKAIQTLLLPDTKVPEFYIVKRDTAAAQTKTITFDKDLTANCRINGTVNGVAIDEVVFTTDQATTMALFETALELIDGVASATVSSTPFRMVTVVADADYNLDMSFTVTGIEKPPTVTLATTVAGRTIVDDINEMITNSNGWFVGLTVQKNDGIIMGMSRTLQVLGKDFVFQESDTTIANKTAGNIVLKLKDQSSPTNAIWHGIDTEYADFAFVGALYIYDPYVVDAVYKTLDGVTPSPYTGTGALTTTQEQNLLDQNCNYFRQINTRKCLYPGVRLDGSNWSEKRDIAYLKDQVQLNVFDFLSSGNKRLFIDSDFQKIGAIIKERALNAVVDADNIGFILDGSVQVTIPTRADFTAIQRSSGKASGFRLKFTIAKTLKTVEILFLVSI